MNDLHGPALGPDEKDDEGNERGADPLRRGKKERAPLDIAPKLGTAGLVYLLVSIGLNLAGVDAADEFLGLDVSWNQVASALSAAVAGYLKGSDE